MGLIASAPFARVLVRPRRSAFRWAPGPTFQVGPHHGWIGRTFPRKACRRRLCGSVSDTRKDYHRPTPPLTCTTLKRGERSSPYVFMVALHAGIAIFSMLFFFLFLGGGDGCLVDMLALKLKFPQRYNGVINKLRLNHPRL